MAGSRPLFRLLAIRSAFKGGLMKSPTDCGPSLIFGNNGKSGDDVRLWHETPSATDEARIKSQKPL